MTVTRSPVGEVSATLAIDPENAELRRGLGAVEDVRGDEASRNRSLVPKAVEPPSLAVVEEVGQQLFESLMEAEVRSCFRRSLDRAKDAG